MINKFNDVLSTAELEELNEIITIVNDFEIDKNLGREQITLNISNEIKQKLISLINKAFDTDLIMSSISYAHYSNKYGTPNLPPHFDGDYNDIILDFQLSSNTSWNLGLGHNKYALQDNSAIAFNPNEIIHWRPIKEFKDGEYIKMIFFRFCKASGRSDYSDRIYSQDHQIFKEINELRENSE